MNWLKRKVRRWLDSEQDEVTQYNTMSKDSLGMAVSTREISTDPTLQFKVYSAVGGKIVEFSRYDRKSDRSDHQIYIISKDEDFGEKIAKISTLEVLR
jgi:hypothetical protein